MSALILYPKNETAFDTNGLGILADVVDDEVCEELNGQFELTVQYPVTGRHFADIVTDAFITAKPNPVSDPQPFRIYRITKPLRGVVTIYARHYAYNCKKIVASPFAASSASAALQGLNTNAANACPFEFWTDKTTAGEMKVAVPTDIWTLLGNSKGSILDVYGGEYEFVGHIVKLWNRRGADRGVSIRYGKNLTDLKMDESIANVYTGVYPYWTDGEGNLVTLPEKYISGPGTYDEEKILPLDLSQEFETRPSEDELRASAEKYIADNDIGKPDISWTVEFVALEQTTEYKGKALLERVLLGDTVSVTIPQLNVDVSARAVAVRYKPTLERYKNIALGKVRANLATTIAQQGQAISQATNPSAWQGAVNRATSWITNGRGYMVAVRDAGGNWQEICSLDTPDINTAINVWRWNNGGLGFSRNGYNGPYEVAITQEGEIVADFITTGTLDATLIKAGVITSSDGTVKIDLTNNKVIVETLVEGAAGRFELSSAGIAGYGWDYEQQAFVRTLSIEPGYQRENNAGMTTIRTDQSTSGMSIATSKAGSMLQLGQPLAELMLLGSTIYLAGKTISWKDNGDGTFALVGQ